MGNSTEATDSMKIIRHGWTFLFALLTRASMLHAQEVKSVQQRTANGVLEGVVSADGKVRAFKGDSFAAPPVGPLRWKPPQPPRPGPVCAKPLSLARTACKAGFTMT